MHAQNFLVQVIEPTGGRDLISMGIKNSTNLVTEVLRVRVEETVSVFLDTVIWGNS